MLWRAPEVEWIGEPTFILGGGPSLKGFDASVLKGRGRVIAINEAGLTMAPWADILFWADQRWLEWNKDRLHLHTGARKLCRSIPTIELPVKAKAMIYNARNFSTKPERVGGACAGSSALNLAYLMGSRVAILLGFDMHDPPLYSWKDGNWHDKHQAPPLLNQRRERFIPVFEAWAPQLLDLGMTVINTNRRSALRCFPFADLEELLALDDLSKLERAKYEEVWQHQEYRKSSPGRDECEKAAIAMDLKAGSSLIDFGSGPCRATKWFKDLGLSVLGIDLAENANEFPDDIKVEIASLWDLPDHIEPADYGYCTDVMEHIPSNKVDAVLSTIACLVKEATWFHISTRPDNYGPRLIAAPLHMTIQKGEWWRNKILDHFPIVDVIEKNKTEITILARP